MKICILASDIQKKELEFKTFSEGSERIFVNNERDLHNDNGIDLYILLEEKLNPYSLYGNLKDKPVIINSVTDTLKELNAPSNFHRINGWNGFLRSPIWEIACGSDKSVMNLVKHHIGDCVEVPDVPGFVAARIIAMIINEAYLTWEDGITSKEEIDTAMKLGTNYPFGPFEWASLIGCSNIITLLNKLVIKDHRYKVSNALVVESMNK